MVWKTENPHVKDWNYIFISRTAQEEGKEEQKSKWKTWSYKAAAGKCGENTSRYNKQLLPEYDSIHWWNNKWGGKWTKGCLHSQTTCPVKWEPEEQGKIAVMCSSGTYAQNA